MYKRYSDTKIYSDDLYFHAFQKNKKQQHMILKIV